MSPIRWSFSIVLSISVLALGCRSEPPLVDVPPEPDGGLLPCVDGETQSCGSAVGACKQGTQVCVDGGWGECAGSVGPTPETCNGTDDNCDGQLDEGSLEGYTNACGGSCGLPTALGGTCDGPDEDLCNDDQYVCDGLNGVTCGTSANNVEACNDSDDDCDGEVDEGCDCTDGDTRPCGTDVGACMAGTETCTNGAWGTCQGAAGPVTETCNGQDDNCDGQTDEGCTCTPSETRACGTNTGACTAGTQTCASNGTWGACVGEVGPTAEVCDGTNDDDCDGTVDDGCACTNGATRSCGTSTGVCSTGTETCANGAWGTCVGEVGPVSEICGNGLDEDCDGTADDGCGCGAGAWTTSLVDDTSNFDSFASLGVDSNDGLHAVYHDVSNTALRYAYRPAGGSWTNELVDATGDTGSTNGIGVDSSNGIHAVYLTDASGSWQLMYAYKSSPSGSWSKSAISGTSVPLTSALRHVSMDVDGSKGVHVAYIVDSVLKYAYKPSGGSWSIKSADSSGEARGWTSIAVSSSKDVHIAYNGDSYVSGHTVQFLKYAYKAASSSSFTVSQVPESSSAYGFEASMDLDGSGRPVISYYEIDNQDLWVATKSGSTWTTTKVDFTGNVGRKTAVRVAPSGAIHVRYFDDTNNMLKHAYKPSGGAWTAGNVIASNDGCFGPSLIAIDSTGEVHLGYCNGSRDFLVASGCK